MGLPEGCAGALRIGAGRSPASEGFSNGPAYGGGAAAGPRLPHSGVGRSSPGSVAGKGGRTAVGFSLPFALPLPAPPEGDRPGNREKAVASRASAGRTGWPDPLPDSRRLPRSALRSVRDPSASTPSPQEDRRGRKGLEGRGIVGPASGMWNPASGAGPLRSGGRGGSRGNSAALFRGAVRQALSPWNAAAYLAGEALAQAELCFVGRA